MPRPRLQRLFDSLDVAVASSAAAARRGRARRFPARTASSLRESTSTGSGRRSRGGPAPCGCSSPPGIAAPGSRRAAALAPAPRGRRAARIELHVCGHDAQESRFGYLVPAAFAGRVTFHGRLSARGDAGVRVRRRRALRAVARVRSRAGVILTRRWPPRRRSSPATSPVTRRSSATDSRACSSRAATRGRSPRRCARSSTSRRHARALRRGRRPAGRGRFDWEHVADELEELYDEVVRRRRHPVARRRRQQRELFADFHVHSDHSKDSVSAVAAILERAREVGLDVVAITDHDSVDGGLEAREFAEIATACASSSARRSRRPRGRWSACSSSGPSHPA